MAKYQEWTTPEGLAKIEGWARSGLIDEQIAHNIGINTATLYRWKDQHSEICEAIKKGKQVADQEVENALFKRACGYKCVEIRRAPRQNVETGETVLEVISETEKEVPPDVTAAIFWLKNRKPEEWRDGKNLELSGKVVPSGDFEIVIENAEPEPDLFPE